MTRPFSTHVLDRALARRREENERLRREVLEAVFAALAELSATVAFDEAWVFGSLAGPGRFAKRSDVDIAVSGLRDEDFLRAAAFLSDALGRPLDLLQIQTSRHEDKIRGEGIPWKKNA